MTPAKRGRRRHRTPSGRTDGGGDLPVPIVNPKDPDMVISREHRRLQVGGRRQDLGAVQRRARWRRLPERMDQSERSEHHPARLGSGCSRHRSTAATRGAPGTTSRPRSSITSTPTTISISGLRRAAGERIGVRHRAAATMARSRFANGIPSESKSTATRFPIRANPDIVYGGEDHPIRSTHAQNQNISPVAAAGADRHRRRERPRIGRCARCPSCSRPSTNARSFLPTTISGKLLMAV